MRQICQPPDGLGFFESSTKKCKTKINKYVGVVIATFTFQFNKKEQGGDTRKKLSNTKLKNLAQNCITLKNHKGGGQCKNKVM
jgi:hypothetical protein